MIRPRAKIWWTGLGFAAAAGLMAALIVWQLDAPQREARQATTRQVAAAKALLSQRLNNPQSLRFRNLRVGYDEVCGEVSSIDRAGRATGFEHFRVVQGQAELRRDYETQPIEAHDRWDKALTYCIIMGDAVEEK